jgi:hypothetical protein
MTARNGLPDNLALRSSNVLRCVEHLFGRGDVISGSRQQVNRARDVAQVEPLAQTHELPLGEGVVLEELLDCLQVPAPGQIERGFIPAREGLTGACMDGLACDGSNDRNGGAGPRDESRMMPI